MTKEKLLKRIKQGALLAVAAVMLVTSVGATSVDAAKISKPARPKVTFVGLSSMSCISNLSVKHQDATGFEVKIAKDKKFKKGVKTVKVKNDRPESRASDEEEGIYNTSLDLDSLRKKAKFKEKQTYYVKVRAYNKSGKKVKYSKWSKVKKAKVGGIHDM